MDMYIDCRLPGTLTVRPVCESVREWSYNEEMRDQRGGVTYRKTDSKLVT